MTEENKLDAYGHLTWTVGNEDWIACFDARRVTDGIEYHVVVDCESGGFTDTIEHGTVPATVEGIVPLFVLPGRYADMCVEMYLDKPADDQDGYGEVEWQDTDASWRRHLEFLLTVEPEPDEVDENYSDEQSLDYFNRYIAGDR